MYACICSAVTVDEVNHAIDSGADTVADLGDLTCAGVSCGSCHPTLEDMIESKCGGCPKAALSLA